MNNFHNSDREIFNILTPPLLMSSCSPSPTPYSPPAECNYHSVGGMEEKAVLVSSSSSSSSDDVVLCGVSPSLQSTLGGVGAGRVGCVEGARGVGGVEEVHGVEDVEVLEVGDRHKVDGEYLTVADTVEDEEMETVGEEVEEVGEEDEEEVEEVETLEEDKDELNKVEIVDVDNMDEVMMEGTVEGKMLEDVIRVEETSEHSETDSDGNGPALVVGNDHHFEEDYHFDADWLLDDMTDDIAFNGSYHESPPRPSHLHHTSSQPAPSHYVAFPSPTAPGSLSQTPAPTARGGPSFITPASFIRGRTMEIVSDDNITPMPQYHNLQTPQLKKECSKFGVRVLPKRKMIAKLTEIYTYTHPLVGMCILFTGLMLL